MKESEAVYQAYIRILEEELLPAMGCTEPIAVAYCGAVARQALGALPDRVEVEASGNIIKNVKSVVVPNTGHRRGIPAAVAAGIVAGDPSRQLEVISRVTAAQQADIGAFLEEVPVEVRLAESPLIFDIVVTVHRGSSYARARIANFHTNVVLVEKDGEALVRKDVENQAEGGLTDRNCLTVAGIVDFADTVVLSDVSPLLDTQIAYNMAIAEEGLKGDYGANVGTVLLASHPEVLSAQGPSAVRLRARAMAAAGSDARMNGCELPVVINSGSGNQGITVSVPVAVYARHLGSSREELYRALVVSNLLAVHIKHGIGPLSAFCGAVSAGCAAGCGIAYLYGGREEEIAHTLVNSLATVSGIFCDGAKASCAAKIASSIEAGILGYFMYRNGQQFYGEDGIVSKGVENTIRNICRLGGDAMNETDEEIIRIMTHCD